MTEVSFHFNVLDKVQHACRLLRKAHAAANKVVVLGEPELLRALDSALWTFSPLDFIAHSNPQSSPAVVQASPVQLMSAVRDAPHRQVLLNLGRQVPAGFEEFAKLIEVVSTEEADKLAARPRWKHYQEQGYQIIRHDLNQSA